MSLVNAILTEFQWIGVWFENMSVGLRSRIILLPGLHAMKLRRPWFSSSSAEEFEIKQLARNELYRSLSRVPLAR